MTYFTCNIEYLSNIKVEILVKLVNISQRASRYEQREAERWRCRE